MTDIARESAPRPAFSAKPSDETPCANCGKATDLETEGGSPLCFACGNEALVILRPRCTTGAPCAKCGKVYIGNSKGDELCFVCTSLPHPLKCPNPNCDKGIIKDTNGVGCAVCSTRLPTDERPVKFTLRDGGDGWFYCLRCQEGYDGPLDECPHCYLTAYFTPERAEQYQRILSTLYCGACFNPWEQHPRIGCSERMDSLSRSAFEKALDKLDLLYCKAEQMSALGISDAAYNDNERKIEHARAALVALHQEQKTEIGALHNLVTAHHAQGALDGFRAGEMCPVCEKVARARTPR